MNDPQGAENAPGQQSPSQQQAAQQQGGLQGTVTIGDRSIDISQLSENARKHLQALRFADGEIANLRMKLALAEAGKQAIGVALQAELQKMLQEDGAPQAGDNAPGVSS